MDLHNLMALQLDCWWAHRAFAKSNKVKPHPLAGPTEKYTVQQLTADSLIVCAPNISKVCLSVLSFKVPVLLSLAPRDQIFSFPYRVICMDSNHCSLDEFFSSSSSSSDRLHSCLLSSYCACYSSDITGAKAVGWLLLSDGKLLLMCWVGCQVLALLVMRRRGRGAGGSAVGGWEVYQPRGGPLNPVR